MSSARSAARADAVSLVLTPILSVIAALAVGAIIIAWAGDSPLEIYRIVFSEALFARTGWRDTLINATPLVLIGVGLAIAFRADVWNIGAEGQMMIGALCSIAVIGYVNELPGAVLIPLGLVLGAVGGGLWGALAGWIHVRFGVNVVIATLLLVFVAEPLLTWAVRDPFKDPETFLPQSRVVGNAALPHLGWIDVHIGALLVLVVVPVAAWLMSSTRLGYVVRAHGGNRTATTANEVRPGRLPFALIATSGALAGIAGFVQLAGVQNRVATGSAAGFGFTAIIVAVLGRTNPVGVLISAVGLSAMLVGAEAAQRESGLPVSLMQTIQALIVVFVVAGDAISARVRARRGDVVALGPARGGSALEIP
jgi:general nucleoside transport system permease protein